MRIRRIALHLLEAPLARAFGNARGFLDRRASLLIEAEAEDGTVGWGEIYGPARLNFGPAKEIADLLIGRDGLAREAIWHDLHNRFRDHGRGGLVVEVISGIDIALWDLAGKRHGLPVCRLLGGPVRERIQAYASGLFRYRDGDPAGELAGEAARHAASGFRAVKMKIGFGHAADCAAVATVRQALGPSVALMVDANQAYDGIAAARLARAIEPLDIDWFEEPVPPDDLDGYRMVRAASSIPTAGGEAEYTRWGFRRALEARAIDILQPDICGAGGITECKKIADMAAAFGVRFMPHNWGTGISTAATLHLLGALPRVPDSLYPAMEPMLEFDMTEHPVRDALLAEPLAPAAGEIAVPTGAGLGIAIDRPGLERHRLATAATG